MTQKRREIDSGKVIGEMTALRWEPTHVTKPNPRVVPLQPIVVDGEGEWEVEEILDSRWYRKRFQFLVKWKDFSREHNSWEVASDVKALDLVTKYYWKHPAAPRHIRQTDFDAIFQPWCYAAREFSVEM